MKKYYILNQNNNDVCCIVHAKNEKSALKKYSSKLLTAGLYTIIKENNAYKLISSYGSNFIAIPCNYKYNGYLTEIL